MCIPGGRAIKFPDSTGRIFIPEGADIELIPGGEDPGKDDGLSFVNRTVLVVRVSGTGESPIETLERMRCSRAGKAAVDELHESPIRALLLLQD